MLCSTLPKTNSSPLKIRHPQKETSHSSLPIIHFQVRTVSFREGKSSEKRPTIMIFGPLAFLILRLEPTPVQHDL